MIATTFGVGRRRLASLGSAIALATGVVVMLAGTFSPWLRSGEVTRNSYGTAGLIKRLLDVHGPAAAALEAMPLLPVLCALSALAFGFGWRRVATAFLGILGVLLLALSVAVLLAPTGRGISVDRLGPAITVIGSSLTLAGAVGFSCLTAGR